MGRKVSESSRNTSAGRKKGQEENYAGRKKGEEKNYPLS